VPHLRIATLLLIGMLVGGKAAIAGYVFTTIDSPDLFDTTAWGINDSGQIVGNSGGSGFLDTGGSFTTIHFPGAYRTLCLRDQQ